MERRVELSSGHEVWTNIVGDGPGLPLLLFHGVAATTLGKLPRFN